MLYVNESINEIDLKIAEASSKIDEARELLTEVHKAYANNFPEMIITKTAGRMADMLFEVEYMRHLIYDAIYEVKVQQVRNK